MEKKNNEGGRVTLSTPHRKGLWFPNWVALAAGIALGKLVHWGLSRTKPQVETSELILKEWVPREVVAHGPWGGPGGDPFYDGRGDIVEIKVNYDANWVIKLQVNYEQSGAKFQAEAHGSSGGESAKITLNYPKEYLKQVTGTYGPAPVNTTVTSLTFVTNKKTYGPYGVPRGQSFGSPPTGVVGFFGRSSSVVDQLGVLTLRT